MLSLFAHIFAILTAVIFIILSAWFLNTAYKLKKASKNYSTDTNMEKACNVVKRTGDTEVIFGWISLAIGIVLFGLSAAALFMQKMPKKVDFRQESIY
jgi:H+/gluconate symporter-like permease